MAIDPALRPVHFSFNGVGDGAFPIKPRDLARNAAQIFRITQRAAEMPYK
jgi:hypothetical protein